MSRRVSPNASVGVPTETPAHGQPKPQVSGKIYLPGNGPGLPSDQETCEARLRVFVCHECGTAEPVAWCGQRPDCGHLECTEALAKCSARHRVDNRRFHGQVNVAIVERRLWDRYEEKAAEEAR